MKCLCCYKELKDEQGYWHRSCIKKFYGTDTIPELDLTESGIELLATEQIEAGKSVTGVQKKLSPVYLSPSSKKATLKEKSNQHIIKPNTNAYPWIAESEFLVMHMANTVGIKTPLFGLIEIGNGKRAYIVKRMDRTATGKVHMEDFSQLSGKASEYKYQSSYEKCVKIIQSCSRLPAFDISELFNRLIFCFITLNSDMHLKNFSFIEDERGATLCPAYDLLPVQLMVNDLDDTALTINGKKRNLKRNDFIKFGVSSGIDKKACNNMIDGMLKHVPELQNQIRESLLPESEKEAFVKKMNERLDRLKKNTND